MPLSNDTRAENINKALLIMLEELKHEPLWTREFEPDEPIFKGIFQTTWPDLEEKGLVTPRHTLQTRRYALTGHGWYTAMELIWDENSTVLEPILGRIMATLKSYVAGRNEDAWADCSEVAQKAGVQFGFLYNLIESNFIEYHLGKHGAHWTDGDHGRSIDIPSRFGLPLL